MRCGCSNACACLVAGCDDGSTTVTGSGSASDPYKVCVTRGLEVVDTNTVDHTLTGTGTAADPWTLQSAVIIDPDSGDLLVATPDGLLVSCDAVQRCVGLAVAEGQGLEYVENNIDDPVSGDGALSVCISTDNNNVLQFGTDGCLLVPSGDQADCITSLSDCLVTEVDGNGACTIQLAIDPDPCNLLECGPNGLTVLPDEAHASARVEMCFGAGVVVTDTNDVRVEFGPSQIIQITNPSDCRDMRVLALVEAQSLEFITGNSQQFLLGPRISSTVGGPTITNPVSEVGCRNCDSTETRLLSTGPFTRTVGTLGPGAIGTVDVRMFYRTIAPDLVNAALGQMCVVVQLLGFPV